jgi:hypothetical protein
MTHQALREAPQTVSVQSHALQIDEKVAHDPSARSLQREEH